MSGNLPCVLAILKLVTVTIQINRDCPISTSINWFHLLMSAWLCFCTCHLGLSLVTLWELIFLSTVLPYFTVQHYFSSDFKISEITDQGNPRRCSHPIIRRFRASLEMLPPRPHCRLACSRRCSLASLVIPHRPSSSSSSSLFPSSWLWNTLWRAFSTSSWATPRFRSSWWNQNIFQEQKTSELLTTVLTQSPWSQSLWDLSKEKRGKLIIVPHQFQPLGAPACSSPSRTCKTFCIVQITLQPTAMTTQQSSFSWTDYSLKYTYRIWRSAQKNSPSLKVSYGRFNDIWWYAFACHLQP